MMMMMMMMMIMQTLLILTMISMTTATIKTTMTTILRDAELKNTLFTSLLYSYVPTSPSIVCTQHMPFITNHSISRRISHIMHQLFPIGTFPKNLPWTTTLIQPIVRIKIPQIMTHPMARQVACATTGPLLHYIQRHRCPP